MNKLRHQRRFCRSLRKKQSEGTLLEVPKPQQELYTRFLDGSLDEELDEAIRIHDVLTTRSECPFLRQLEDQQMTSA